jgi:hypothetical protein
MGRDAASGSLLIVGAASGVLVMLLHPTAHGLLDPASGSHLSHVNTFVHGLALAATPLVFLGLLGLRRRLESTDLTTAAIVLYGWGCVAVMSAAVASGFVATDVIRHLQGVEASTAPDLLLHYTGMWNHGFTKVYVVATSIAIVLFSVEVLHTRKLARARACSVSSSGPRSSCCSSPGI